MIEARRQHGFTLIELLLVLVVLTVLLSVAAPSLRGWNRGTRLRDTADDLLAAARQARMEAIATATIHRLEVSPGDGGYRVTMLAGEEYVPARGDYGQARRLPQGVWLEMSRGDGRSDGVIEFHPLGRSTPARIRISSDWGDFMEIESTTPAEPFRVSWGMR